LLVTFARWHCNPLLPPPPVQLSVASTLTPIRTSLWLGGQSVPWLGVVLAMVGASRR
jgi:hypothetical protein